MHSHLEKAHDRILWTSDNIRIGTFTAKKEFVNFSNSGPIQDNIIVFANQPVAINKKKERIIANHNTVLFYNRGEEYTREALNHFGDFAHWIALSPEVLEGFNGLCGINTDKQRLFELSYQSNNAKSFFIQKQLYRLLYKANELSSLLIYEEIAMLMDSLANEGTVDVSQLTSLQAVKVEQLLEYVSEHYQEPLTIDKLAKEVYLSPFHLCRLFKKATRLSIHQYILQLRIKQGLNEVCDSQQSLLEIACQLNFASHSHFSAAFKKNYQISPSQLRI